MRNAIFTLHRWAALVTALFVVILGVTGGIMAFEPELDHLFHAHLFHVAPQPHALSLAELGAAASKTFPGERVTGYGLPVSPDLSYSVSFRSGAVFVNQYTGEILGVRQGRSVLDDIHQIHLRLLAGDTGKMIVSWVGVVMLFLLLSGLYLWWPLKRVTIAWEGSAPSYTRRTWFDLHNAVGVFSLLFLLILTLTGVAIGFERVTTPLFYRVTRSEPVAANFKATPQPGAKALAPDEAVSIARGALPGAAPIGVNVPGPNAVYFVRLRYPEDLTPGGRSRVYVDPYSGAVLQAESSRTTAGGQRLVIANRAIHTGDIFGIPSKIVMSIASFLAALQAITGVLMWWKRAK